MGGLGVTIGYGMSYLIDVFSSVHVGRQVTFIIVSIIMIFAVIVLFWKVKEREAYSYKLLLEAEEKEGAKVKEEKKKPGLIESINDILSEEDKSTLSILFAVFFWYIGYQGILALISIYGVDVLGYSEGLAGFIPFFVSVPLIITVYPLGIVSTKIGRRKAIKIGILIWIGMLIVTFFLSLMSVGLAIIAIPLAILGPGWALINVNSIVIVWELAPNEQKIGTYTGLYYFFSFLAAILGPMIIGGLTDLFTQYSLLLNGAFFFIIAFIMMVFVKRGEAELTEQEKIAKEKAIQEL
jgi:Na+/melibiose symporter-like transporter